MIGKLIENDMELYVIIDIRGDETLILNMDEDHYGSIYFSFDIIETYDFYDDHNDVTTSLSNYVKAELFYGLFTPNRAWDVFYG